MKRLIFLLAILFVGLTMEAQVIKYPFGAATVKTVANDSISLVLTPTNTLEFLNITAAIDTNVTVTVDLTNAKAGNMLYLQLKADGTNRTLTFSTGIKGTALTVTASKTFLITAIYNGTQYIVLATKQED